MNFDYLIDEQQKRRESLDRQIDKTCQNGKTK